jgi:hypothetical protein
MWRRPLMFKSTEILSVVLEMKYGNWRTRPPYFAFNLWEWTQIQWSRFLLPLLRIFRQICYFTLLIYFFLLKWIELTHNWEAVYLHLFPHLLVVELFVFRESTHINNRLLNGVTHANMVTNLACENGLRICGTEHIVTSVREVRVYKYYLLKLQWALRDPDQSIGLVKL